MVDGNGELDGDGVAELLEDAHDERALPEALESAAAFAAYLRLNGADRAARRLAEILNHYRGALDE